MSCPPLQLAAHWKCAPPCLIWLKLRTQTNSTMEIPKMNTLFGGNVLYSDYSTAKSADSAKIGVTLKWLKWGSKCSSGDVDCQKGVEKKILHHWWCFGATKSEKTSKIKVRQNALLIHQNDSLGELIKLNTTTCRDIGIGCWKNGRNKKKNFSKFGKKIIFF